MKLNLIGEAASDPVRIHLVPIPVDSDIERLDLSVVIKGCDNGNGL